MSAVPRGYSEWHDDELKTVVAEGLGDLVPEALLALKAELRRRGFRALARAVDRRLLGVTLESVDSLVTWLRSRRCPACRRSRALLNGCVVHSGFGVDFVLACPPCLEAAVESASAEHDGSEWPIPLARVHRREFDAANRSGLAAALGPEPTDDLLDYVQRHYEMLCLVSGTALGAKRQLRSNDAPADR